MKIDRLAISMPLITQMFKRFELFDAQRNQMSFK